VDVDLLGGADKKNIEVQSREKTIFCGKNEGKKEPQIINVDQ
jgi:hypothetical protein